EITCGIADAASLAAGRPFVEHRLLQGVVHPLKCDQCAGLLFLFQGEEALRQTKVFSRARYCTYFIIFNTLFTYCTVLLRIPKTAVLRAEEGLAGLLRFRESSRPVDNF